MASEGTSADKFAEDATRENVLLLRRYLPLTVVLMLAWSGLDWVFAREHMILFLGLRLAACVGAWLCVRVATGLKNPQAVQIYTAWWVFCLLWNVSIAVMLFYVGSDPAPYIAGASIVMTAAGVYPIWPLPYVASNVAVQTVLLMSALALGGASRANLLLGAFAFVSIGAAAVISARFRFAGREALYRMHNKLTVANAELRSLDQAKTRFFSNMTHEFRTPLVALSSTVQMALEGGLKDEALLTELLGSGRDAIDDMLDNVNSLLLTARATEGREQMAWRQIELLPWIERALAVFRTIAADRGVALELDAQLPEGLTLYADHEKLKKIFNNLVGNALKFTSRGGRVTIGLSTEIGDSGEFAVIEVADTGKGIPAEDLGSIFEAFTQASNNQMREVQGTGIGLSLVKAFSELHRGTVDVVSELGSGTTFHVKLPLGDAHVDFARLDRSDILFESQDVTRPAAARGRGDRAFDFSVFNDQQAGKASLLIVEDNPQIAHVLGHVLHPENNLRFAPDGVAGLAEARRESPDLIISDVMMPRKNGIELVTELKADPGLRAVPVIMLTSKGDQASRIAGYKAGADEYLAKPFNNEEVLLRVRGLLARKKLEQELVQAEKMVGLGHLVAGIAHEINNPISYTKSSTRFARKVFSDLQEGTVPRAKAEPLIYEALDRAQHGADRVAEIVSALMGFANPNAEKKPMPQDIHKGIRMALAIAKNQVGFGLEIQQDLRLRDEVPCVLNLLNQVFLNLFMNAFDAVKDVPEPRVSIRTERKGDSALITVTDNGEGIEPEVLDRIFEPFFTTKDVGSGMGLGLYVSHTIVEKHGGTLVAEPVATGGTRFCVSLPIGGIGEVAGSPEERNGALEEAQSSGRR